MQPRWDKVRRYIGANTVENALEIIIISEKKKWDVKCAKQRVHTVLVVELPDSAEYMAYSRKNAEIVLDPCVGQRSNLFFEDQ